MTRASLIGLLACLAAGAPPARPQDVVEFTVVAEPGDWEIEPGHVVTNGWFYNGQMPGPAPQAALLIPTIRRAGDR